MDQKIKYEVDYEFHTRDNGERFFTRVKAGFRSENEAQRWADNNTVDGVVVSTMMEVAR